MRAVAYSGLGISVAGAALDYVSGYSLGSVRGVGTMSGEPTVSAVALYALGTGVLIAGILTVLPSMTAATRRLGILMEVFGVLMALASAWVPGMYASLSDAMLIIGALMILNGALMQRHREMGREADKTPPAGR